MDRTYRDSNGDRVDLAVLCHREPGWATNRILELTRQVDALLRGNAQMRLLAGLPLPPDVVDKLREADRLRKIFDDAGQGEHNVLALIGHYQRSSMEADERLRAVRGLLEEHGCDCPCDHHPVEHGPGCEVCLACRIGEVIE